MTTLNEARKSIYEHFIGGYGATPYALENESFDPPENEAWVRLSVRTLDGGQETIGASPRRKFERQGIIVADISTPINTGMLVGDEIGQQILDLFEAKRVDSVRCDDGFVRESPPEDEWMRHIAQIGFRYEETK